MVGPGEENEPLRYSLRSLANLRHDQVWLAGHRPEWVTGVRHIRVGPQRGKARSSAANLRAACQHPEVSSEFVYMNDDFYVLQQLEVVPMYHRGPLSAFLQKFTERQRKLRRRHRSVQYSGGREDTAELMQELGVAEPLAYEPLHTPMVMAKEGMLEALQRGARVPALHYRTLYGNLAQVGGALATNHKISDTARKPDPDWLFLSTDKRSFERGVAGRIVRERFATPSPYERN